MTTIKLTPTQRLILQSAANRHDRLVLPVAKLANLSAGSTALTIRALLRKSLVEERPADSGTAVWREDDEGQALTVVISEAGLEALGLLPDDDADAGFNVQEGDKGPADSAAQQDGAPVVANTDAANEGAANPDTAGTAAASDQPRQPRPGTKLAALVALLSRPEGATVDEMVAATAWLPHSVRGVLSGALPKRFGMVVTSGKIEGRGRVYRAAEGPKLPG